MFAVNRRGFLNICVRNRFELIIEVIVAIVFETMADVVFEISFGNTFELSLGTRFEIMFEIVAQLF